jgi:malate dehydrogenase
MDIVADLTRAIMATSPKSIIIVVTNPVDAMTHLALQISKFSRNKVLGLSGALDASRFAYFIASELNISVNDVSGCVLGQHGETMVVVPRLTMVKGVPVTELLPPDIIDKLVQRTINAGTEVINLLNLTGRAFYATSAAILKMIDAVILDKKAIIPCSIALKGEYGIKDLAIGVPVKLGSHGARQIVELPLCDEEKTRLQTSAEAVRQQVKLIQEKMAETGK